MVRGTDEETHIWEGGGWKCAENFSDSENLKPQFFQLQNGVILSLVQSLSRVRLFATPWTAACQAFLSITNSRSPPKPMSIESVMPSSHLILCCPLLLLPSIFPSIRVFSNEPALHMMWPKYWSFSFSISPSSEHPGQISRMDWSDLAVQGSYYFMLVPGTLWSLSQC